MGSPSTWIQVHPKELAITNPYSNAKALATLFVPYEMGDEYKAIGNPRRFLKKTLMLDLLRFLCEVPSKLTLITPCSSTNHLTFVLSSPLDALLIVRKFGREKYFHSLIVASSQLENRMCEELFLILA